MLAVRPSRVDHFDRDYGRAEGSGVIHYLKTIPKTISNLPARQEWFAALL